MSINPIAEYLGYAGDGGFSETDHRHTRHILEHGPWSKKVSQRLCEEIRRRRHNGASAPTVHDGLPVDISRSSMDAHAAGRCTHPNDVPPVDARGQISQVCCALLRVACWGGSSQADAAALPTESVDQTTVFHHVTGRCRHDVEVSPVEYPTVTEAQCRHWRDRRERGDGAQEIADGSAFAQSTVSKHTLGNCEHGGADAQ